MAKIILNILNPEKYFAGVINILKTELKGKNVIYITTNKPYGHIINVLKEHGIRYDKIFFIDCISRHIGNRQQEPKNCLFVESPQSLTYIGIAINESVKRLSGEKVLLLDSLSTLLIYNDANAIAKFSNFLINTMRSLDVDTSILALESDINKDTIKQIESFADEVKRYGS